MDKFYNFTKNDFVINNLESNRFLKKNEPEQTITGNLTVTDNITTQNLTVIDTLTANNMTTNGDISTTDGLIEHLETSGSIPLNTKNFGDYAGYSEDGVNVEYKGYAVGKGEDKLYIFTDETDAPTQDTDLNTLSKGSISIRTPISNDEGANKKYVDDGIADIRDEVDINKADIITITNAVDTNKTEIETLETSKLNIAGGTLTGELTLPTNNNIKFSPTSNNITGGSTYTVIKAGTKYIDINTGFTRTNNELKMENNRISGLGNPLNPDDATNRTYVDDGIADIRDDVDSNKADIIILANDVDTNTTDIETLETSKLSLDGSLSMTGNINLSNNGLINCDSISSGTQTLTSTNNIFSTYENINVNSYLFETPNSQVCKLALKTQTSAFNDWIGKAMLEFQVDMAGIRDLPSGRIVSTPDFPQFVFQRAFMDFYNCWDFNPDGESGELLHMMRFSDIIRMYRNMDMSGNSIKNMSDGFDAGDAVNKSQLDTKLNLAGGSMTGNINMNTGVLRFGAGNITSTNIDGNAVFTRLRGGNGHTFVINENQCEINTDLNMLTNKIVNVGSPSAATDVANKAYVDSVVPQKYLNTFSLFVSANSAFSYGGFNFENIPEGSNGNRPFKIDMFSRFSYSASSDDLLSISADIAYLDSGGTQIGSTYSTGSAYNPSKTISTTRFITLHNQDIFQFPQGAVKCQVIIVINSTAAISKTGDVIVSINDINGL